MVENSVAGKLLYEQSPSPSPTSSFRMIDKMEHERVHGL